MEAVLKALDEELKQQQQSTGSDELGVDLFLLVTLEENHRARGVGNDTRQDVALTLDEEEAVIEFLKVVRTRLSVSLNEAFRKMDTNRSNVITYAEFHKSLSESGYKGNARAVWLLMDADSNGVLGLREFRALKEYMMHDGKSVGEKYRQMFAEDTTSWGDWEDLDPGLRQEASAVVDRINSSLAERGLPAKPLDEVRGWAVQVAMKKSSISADSESRSTDARDRSSYTMCPDAMLRRAWDPVETKPAQTEHSGFKHVDDLEACVQQTLARYTEKLIAEATAGFCPGPDSEISLTRLQEVLVKDFSSRTDAMMEAVVSGDYSAWLNELAVPSPGTSRQRTLFENLKADFQRALASEISPKVIDQLCQGIADVPELRVAVFDEAAKLRAQTKKEKRPSSSSKRSSVPLPTEATLDLKIKNIDYDLLLCNPQLVAKLSHALQLGVSQEVMEVDSRSVSVDFSEGHYLQAKLTVRPPGDVEAYHVESILRSSRSLCQSLSVALGAIEGLAPVKLSDGPVVVSMASPSVKQQSRVE